MSTFLRLLLLISGMMLSGCATPPPIESAAFDELVRTNIDLHEKEILFKSHWSPRGVNAMGDPKDAFVSIETEMLLLGWDPYQGRYAEIERLAYSKISSTLLKSELFRTYIVIKSRGRTLVLYPSAPTLQGLSRDRSRGQALYTHISEQLEKNRYLPSEPVIIGVALVRSRGEVGLDAGELRRGTVARAGQGAGVGAAPGALLGEMGGGIIAIPIAVAGGVIGGVAGGVIGGFEDLTSDAPTRRSRAESIKSRLALALSILFPDILRDCILNYIEQSSSGHVVKEVPTAIKIQDQHFFIGVKGYYPAEQNREQYWSALSEKEQLTDLLEIVLESVEFAPERSTKARNLEQQPLTLGVKTSFVMTSSKSRMMAFRKYQLPYFSAKAEAISPPYLVSEWLADDGHKVREEYSRVCLAVAKQIVKKILSQYPSPAALQE